MNVTKEVDNFFPVDFKYNKIPVTDETSTELMRHWNDKNFNFIKKAKLVFGHMTFWSLHHSITIILENRTAPY